MRPKGYLRKTAIDIAEIFTEELKHIFRDSGVVILFFAASLLYPLLYGFTYKNEVYHNVPVAVVNQSHSSLSRNFVRQMDATPEMEVAYKVNSMEEAKKLYAENKVYGVVLIPSTFSQDIHAGRQTRILAYSSMASMMYYKGMYAGINYVCLDMGAKIQIENLQLKGLTMQQAKATAQPILSQGHALYNPKRGFASFLLPAVLVMIIQQTLVLGIGMLAGTAREENTFHQLIPYQRKYHGTFRIISGKGLAYLVLYAFIGIYNLIFVPYLFNLPHYLTLGLIFPFLLPFLLACIFFGMSISVFFWNRENSLLLYLCTSVPLLFISGFSWPVESIHPFWKIISYFFPSTFGIQGYLKMNTMGASLNQIGFECMGLWIQAGIYFVFAFFVYRWQIIQSERKIIR
ncbi:MAG: ABC transporter permease [Bacteroidales bacterium]|nr:ABC transporter permease [Bacteroidales bacterium]